MKVLYVYALLIGFTAAAKLAKKNAKKRDHHGKFFLSNIIDFNMGSFK